MRTQDKAKAALLAGLLAVAANTVVLKSAALFHIEAESGGLLRLLRQTLGPTSNQIGLTAIWSGFGLPLPGSLPFWIAFHFGMGIGMAVFYALALEPYLPGPGWVKGAIFSLLPWLLNSAVVMPLLGKGFAAHDALTVGGMVYFFFANGLYGVLVGVLYEWFREMKGT
jgi:hypothetical protein